MTSFDTRTGKRRERKRHVRYEQKHDEVLLSEQLLEAYDSARQDWAQNALEDDEFRNNKQWNEEDAAALEEKQNMPVCVNVIHPKVEQAKAMLTANKPRWTATGREDSDVRVGKIFADILTYIWDISAGNAQLKQMIDDYIVRGMGAAMVYFDPHADMGKGEVKVTSLDPFEVFYDPSAKDIFCRDGAHTLVVKTISVEQFERAYPQLAHLLDRAQRTSVVRHPSSGRRAGEGQQIGTEVLDTNQQYVETIDRYSRIVVKMFHTFDSTIGKEELLDEQGLFEYLSQPAFVVIAGGQQQFVTKPEEVEQLQKMYLLFGSVLHYMQNPVSGKPEMVAGPEGGDPNAVSGSEMLLAPTSLADLAEMGVIVVNNVLQDRIKRVFSVGGVLAYTDILPIEDAPIIPLMNRHNRNPYPMSDVRFVRPLQEYINKMRSLIMAHTANATNVKVFVPQGGVDKEAMRKEFAKAGAGIIEYDAELGNVVVAAPIPLPTEAYHNEEQAKKDIEEILGIFPFMAGNAEQAPNTYKGTVAIDEYGQRRVKSKKDDVEAFLNQLSRVAVQFIQAYYTERKTIRLVQPNDKPKEIQINVPVYDSFTGEEMQRVNDVTTGKYDVVVVAGSMLPANRWAQFEYYMEMYKNGLIDRTEVLKKTELVDIEGVLNRMSEIAQLTQTVQQLQEQVKKLSGDLQTAERESTHDRKRLEVEKFKTELKGVSAKAQAAGHVYEQRLSDQLNLQKTLIAAEGSANEDSQVQSNED